MLRSESFHAVDMRPNAKLREYMSTSKSNGLNIYNSSGHAKSVSSTFCLNSSSSLRFFRGVFQLLSSQEKITASSHNSLSVSLVLNNTRMSISKFLDLEHKAVPKFICSYTSLTSLPLMHMSCIYLTLRKKNTTHTQHNNI